MMRARAALALAALSLLGVRQPAPVALTLTARAVPLNAENPNQETVGRLRYLGGLELASSDPRFGGLSGMRFLPDGRLLAISDAGDWLTLTLDETDGRLTGARDLRIARMTDPSGNPYRGKSDADAEALEIEPDGTRLVAFERNHRIVAYGPRADETRVIAFPDRLWLAGLAPNGGLEAIARVGDTRLFIAEDMPATGYNMILQARGGQGAYGRVRYSPPVGYKPTDAATLDDRTALLLNRRFSPLAGVSATLVALPIDTARMTAGAPTLIAELVPPVTVDNMEALAIRREGGRAVVYMASDDNFSPLQRTLLLKFELLP